MCEVVGCSHTNDHYTDGHFCRDCRKMQSFCECAAVIVKCPVCRAENKTTDDVEKLKVFGLNEQCVVCMDRAINVVLPTCRHMCMCDQCYTTIANAPPYVPDDDLLFDMDDMNDMDDTNDVANYSPPMTGDQYNEAKRVINDRENYYCIVAAEMGHCWYFKYVIGSYQSFFMHSDAWGQYGDSTSDVPKMHAFIEGMQDATLV